MSKSKKHEDITAAAPVVRYSRERLLKSKALAGYQRDFAGVILKDAEYSIEEAKAALDAVLKKGE